MEVGYSDECVRNTCAQKKSFANVVEAEGANWCDFAGCGNIHAKYG